MLAITVVIEFLITLLTSALKWMWSWGKSSCNKTSEHHSNTQSTQLGNVTNNCVYSSTFCIAVIRLDIIQEKVLLNSFIVGRIYPLHYEVFEFSKNMDNQTGPPSHPCNISKLHKFKTQIKISPKIINSTQFIVTFQLNDTLGA